MVPNHFRRLKVKTKTGWAGGARLHWFCTTGRTRVRYCGCTRGRSVGKLNTEKGRLTSLTFAQFGSARSSPILRLNFPPIYLLTTCETNNRYIKGLGQGIPAGEYRDHFVAGQLLVAISYRFQLYPYQLLLHHFFYSHQQFLYDT